MKACLATWMIALLIGGQIAPSDEPRVARASELYARLVKATSSGDCSWRDPTDWDTDDLMRCAAELWDMRRNKDHPLDLWTPVPLTKTHTGSWYGVLDYMSGLAALAPIGTDERIEWAKRREALALEMIRHPKSREAYWEGRPRLPSDPDWDRVWAAANRGLGSARAVRKRLGGMPNDEWCLLRGIDFVSGRSVVVLVSGKPLISVASLKTVGLLSRTSARLLFVRSGGRTVPLRTIEMRVPVSPASREETATERLVPAAELAKVPGIEVREELHAQMVIIVDNRNAAASHRNP